MAPLLPKLRGNFAEFLNNASPVGLRILSSSTCVGLRYGLSQRYSGFSRHKGHSLLYSNFDPSVPSLSLRFCLQACSAPLRVLSSPARTFLMCPHISDCDRCWNLHQLSIGYASQPRLRPRLTQGRQA